MIWIYSVENLKHNITGRAKSGSDSPHSLPFGRRRWKTSHGQTSRLRVFCLANFVQGKLILHTFFVRLNDNIHLILCSSVRMPDYEEFRKNRLIKKKDNDNDMEEDSDEEMLQLLQRRVRRHFPLRRNLLFVHLVFVRECRAACNENDEIPEGRIRFRRINSFEDCLQSGR